MELVVQLLESVVAAVAAAGALDGPEGGADRRVELEVARQVDFAVARGVAGVVRL